MRPQGAEKGENIVVVRVGLIGVGTVAQMMHLPILSDLPDLYKITAVSDVSPSVLSAISEKYNAKAYASPHDLCVADDVDAVFVLSPDQYHFEYAKAALEAGKHVFVEKPVTLCPQELEELIALEKAHPTQICMVGYMRRYANGFTQCKELLAGDDRPIEYMRFRDIILEGDFYMAQCRQPILPQNDVPAAAIDESRKRRYEQVGRALGAGCTDQQRMTYTMLTGLGCHTLSAVRELVGYNPEVLSVAVDGEHVVAVFQFKGFLGIYEIINDQDIVQFDAAIEIYQHSRRMKIKHETPYLRYQPHTFEVVESTKDDTKTTTYGPDYHDSFEIEVKYYHDCIEKGVQPKTDFVDAMADLELFKAMCDKIHV